MFLEGFPTNIQQQVRQRLLIKFPDHHPNDPYPMKDVHAATCFLLPGIAPIAATMTPALVQSPSPQVITMQVPTYQQQAPGVVIKQEYQTTHSGNYVASRCTFCGAHDYFISCCWEKETYISEGKCKIHESKGKIVLPSSNWVPGHPNEGTLKEHLDCYYTGAMPPGATITTGLWYCANEHTDTVIEVDPSTFSQVIIDTESNLDEEDIEILHATQALALATAKHDQKKGGSAYATRGKVCNSIG
jgi:hypothetical protein